MKCLTPVHRLSIVLIYFCRRTQRSLLPVERYNSLQFPLCLANRCNRSGAHCALWTGACSGVPTQVLLINELKPVCSRRMSKVERVMDLAKRICRKIGVGVVTMLLMLAVPAVQANPWFRQSARDGAYQNQRDDRRNDAQRQSFQREEQARNQRPQRMSQEERQQLRRDIRDAGREVYRPRR